MLFKEISQYSVNVNYKKVDLLEFIGPPTVLNTLLLLHSFNGFNRLGGELGPRMEYNVVVKHLFIRPPIASSTQGLHCVIRGLHCAV